MPSKQESLLGWCLDVCRPQKTGEELKLLRAVDGSGLRNTNCFDQRRGPSSGRVSPYHGCSSRGAAAPAARGAALLLRRFFSR